MPDFFSPRHQNSIRGFGRYGSIFLPKHHNNFYKFRYQKEFVSARNLRGVDRGTLDLELPAEEGEKLYEAQYLIYASPPPAYISDNGLLPDLADIPDIQKRKRNLESL